MIFSSATFVLFMIVLVGVLGVVRSTRGRHVVLLIASYIFYGWWDWRFLALIAGSSLWSWAWGNRIARAEARRGWMLTASLCGDLGLLAVFKYANFFVDSFATAFGLTTGDGLNIILPVGISFFTFQSMSYTIDIYRGRLKVCDDPLRFLLFVSFFPQLVAGPIVRASDFLYQLDRPLVLDRDQALAGAKIFLFGLTQKMLFADNMAAWVDPVFARPELYDAATLWGALVAYSMQIFCDFSGYSLMAIGIAKGLSFDLPENFRMPYLSKSPTEFWRRWHISLSTWLRDYLYISLGGNRRGRARTKFNLMATMLLGGLWHGAGWNFVLWGFLHGLGLMVHKAWTERGIVPERIRSAPFYALMAWAGTLLFCMLVWVPFRAQSFDHTRRYLAGLMSADGIHWLHSPSIVLLGGAVAWHLWAQFAGRSERFRPLAPLGYGALIMALMIFGALDASPFIYFQF